MFEIGNSITMCVLVVDSRLFVSGTIFSSENSRVAVVEVFIRMNRFPANWSVLGA